MKRKGLSRNATVVSTITTALVLLLIVILGGGIPTQQQQETTSFCGGKPQTINPTDSWIDKVPARSVFIDPETHAVWVGGSGDTSFVRVYQPSTHQYEKCLDKSGVALTGIANKINKRFEDINVVFDNQGVAVWSTAWNKYKFPADEQNDSYDAVVDISTGNLVVATRSGPRTFDGNAWFDLNTGMVAGALTDNDALLQLPPESWIFGFINGGAVLKLKNVIYGLQPDNVQTWQNPGWKAEADHNFQFPMQVRSFDRLPNGQILVAGDEDKQSGLFLITLNGENKPTSVRLQTSDNPQGFWHLTNAKVVGNSFVFTNWKAGEGGGAYEVSQDLNKVVQLTNIPSLDIAVSGQTAYIATAQGLLVAKLQLSSSLVTPLPLLATQAVSQTPS